MVRLAAHNSSTVDKTEGSLSLFIAPDDFADRHGTWFALPVVRFFWALLADFDF